MKHQPISIEGVFMKKTTHILFTIYLFLIIWIILFKLSISIEQLPHFRSINLIPFYYPNKTTYQIKEVLENIIIFIPFGLYLKTLNIHNSRTIFLGFLLSLSLELSQYIFGIGASDITDLITNTIGVIIGVGIYQLLKKLFKDKTSKIIISLAAVTTILIISLIVCILINN